MNMLDSRPYYAVLSGENTGIYRESSEFEKFVHGIKGARVKRCESEEEALKYIKNPELFNENNERKTPKCTKYVYSEKNSYAYAFVDGSYSPDLEKYGYGGFIDVGSARYIISGSGDDERYIPFKQIAGEILGVIAVIEKALELGIKDIIIHYDCESILNWFDSKGSSELKDYYISVKDNAISKGLNIVFTKVKAHSKVLGNEIADSLAKSAVGIQDFSPVPISLYNVREDTQGKCFLSEVLETV